MHGEEFKRLSLIKFGDYTLEMRLEIYQLQEPLEMTINRLLKLVLNQDMLF